MHVVTGTINLPAETPARIAEHIRINVRDVTFVASSQPLVAATVLDRVPIGPGLDPIPFSIEVPDVQPGIRLNLDVHIDVDGSAGFSAGDLITDTAVPVILEGAPSNMVVRVKLID